MTEIRQPHPIIGQIVAWLSILAAIAFGYYAIDIVDRRPRTQDGYLYAAQAGISPEINGRITALPIHDNQIVAKGQLLFEIDAEPYTLKLDQAHADVMALKAQIALTKRQVASQASGAEAAKIQINRAASQRALAHDTYERLKPLQEKGYVTSLQIDEALTNIKTSQATFSASVEQAEQAKQAIGDVDNLLARLTGAEAAQSLAARDLRNTKVYAPFDGLVSGLDIAEGEYALAGHPLFTLIKAHEWFAVGNFRETELPSIAIGDAATVWLMSDQSRGLAGHVESLGWGVKPENGSGPSLPAIGRTLSWVRVAQRFQVKIKLDSPPEPMMRIGTTVSIKVDHAERH